MKKTSWMIGLVAGIVVGASVITPVTAARQNIADQVLAIMAMPHRNESDRVRDANRSPQLAIEFMGLSPDMTVIEFAPGNGWYSKILAPLLQQQGELYLAYPNEWLADLDPLLAVSAMSAAKKLPLDMGWNAESYHYTFANDIDFGLTDADMLLSIRAYHNLSAADKVRFNRAAFAALKPGGSYVVIDHSRRPMAPETWEMRRREDPVEVIIEVQQAGFSLVKSSTMFYRPDDELIYEVGRKTVTGNTDRFMLVFTKPK